MSFKTILAKVRSMSWLTFLCIITAYFTLILNIPILRHYCNILEPLDQFSIWFAISIPFVLFALLLIIFTIFSFKYIAKPIFFILLTTSGIVFYASLKYNLIFDSDMRLQEHRHRLRLVQQVATHAVRQFHLAIQRPEIEENAGVEQRHRLRYANPLGKLIAPFIQCQAPLRVTCHDVALAQRKA